MPNGRSENIRWLPVAASPHGGSEPKPSRLLRLTQINRKTQTPNTHSGSRLGLLGRVRFVIRGVETMSIRLVHWFAGSLVAFFALSSVVPAAAETAVGSTVESRVLLGFKANNTAIGDMLPKGWVPVTLPQGPVGGSNLIIALIDRHVILDANGEPADPSSGPTVAFLAYGRKDGAEGVRSFVIRVYEEPPLVDPYGNSVAADINRVAGYTDAGGGARTQSEIWTVKPEGGGELSFDLDYKVGALMWSTGGESRPYSALNPDFFRIYRYEQLAGLAMNAAIGRELDGTASFSSTDPDLAKLFDGSEDLVAIVSIPSYVREISLP